MSQSQGGGYLWWLAWRSFTARRQGGGLSFMTTVSILGVAIGVGALVVVLSVMGGFEADLKRKMLAGEPHLEILAENAVAGFSLKEHPIEKLAAKFPEATAAEPFVSSDVVLKRKSFVISSTLIGIRPEMEGTKLWAFDGAFIEGTLANLTEDIKPRYPEFEDRVDFLPGIMLGDQLALQIGADVGDEITVLSPSANVGSALSGGTLSKNFVVAGKFSTGLFNYDAKWAVTRLSEARVFMPDFDLSLAEEEYVTGVAMNLKDPFKVDNVAKKISAFPGLKGLTWQMTNKSLLFALKLEKFTMGAILALIVVVAAFSISGTMMMTVAHKRSQVSVLRSIGMSQKEVARMFLINGFVVGSAGVVLGLAVGLGICQIIMSSKALSLPVGVYYLRHLPVRFLPVEYVVICVLAWILSLVASAYPAVAASRQLPGSGLRCE